MRKTILSYILTCIEECTDEELYHQIIELEETITKVLLEEEDDFIIENMSKNNNFDFSSLNKFFINLYSLLSIPLKILSLEG